MIVTVWLYHSCACTSSAYTTHASDVQSTRC